MSDSVNHPAHYGGAENPYEAIKVIEAWGLGFCLGNCIKYIARAGKKGDVLEDLKKAAWYLQREVENLERGQLMSSWVQEPVQVSRKWNPPLPPQTTRETGEVEGG